MSSIKLSPNPSGAGIFTIEAPNSAVNYTFTLPTQTGTVLTNAGPFTANASASAGAVTIDASNNVGIGTGSPARQLHVSNSNNAFERLETSATGAVAAIEFKNSNSQTHSIGIETSAGNAGFNGSSAYALCLEAAGARDICFATNGAGRARITSGGNLLVGTATDVGFKLDVLQPAQDWTARVTNSNASNPFGLQVIYSGTAPNNTVRQFIYCSDTSAVRMEVRSNGGIANYSGNNVNLSDRREKTNFAPAGEYLSKICAIPVQTFNYIDQPEDDPGLTLGVVAQDVQAVAPELVMESNWGSEDEPKMRLSIYQTDLQYALMKCIQELNAKVAALEARLASDGPSNGGQA